MNKQILYVIAALIVVSTVTANPSFDVKVRINDVEIEPYIYGGIEYYTLNHPPVITNLKVMINDRPVTPYRFGHEYNLEFYNNFKVWPDGFYISPSLAATWGLN